MRSWQNNKKPCEISWTHGVNEKQKITEENWDKETRSLQETRKTTAKMGGLPEERDLLAMPHENNIVGNLIDNDGF